MDQRSTPRTGQELSFIIWSANSHTPTKDSLPGAVDKRRFRANIYLELKAAGGFAEDQFVGRTLRIGDRVVLAILERDPRCKIITLDPDTAEPNPEVMKRVARAHDGKAGIYAAVLVEGTVRSGDDVFLLQ
jgi:uncharacterized protein YcbX